MRLLKNSPEAAKLGKRLYSQRRIALAVARVANSLKRYLRNSLSDSTEITALCILDGACMFFTDLMKHFNDYPVRYEFAKIKSYKGTESSSLGIHLWPGSKAFKGKSAIIVDDIIDSGRTATYVLQRIKLYKPKDIAYVALFKRYNCPELNVPTFAGITLEDNKYVIGYGLDYDGKYRNLRDVFEYKKD